MDPNLWAYTPTSGRTTDASLIGYKVEATDGSIGKVDKHSDEVGSAHLVVDTGPWIFGKRVQLPAGIISSIDAAAEIVYVSRTKDEIKNAPEFDEDPHTDDRDYRERLGGYYGGFMG
ncbi:PRC-barrel domain containing protein [Streptomyces sp. ISL-1]|uniref:PRC-barrel domain containing protein n=1 Tax=unclassified Streptomyces TaxID=2593676 RepID=UPI001BE8858C|nr:PRC-barrel domain containing protein [Streptomyces sp. ISL-1]MBT2392110.1 PRC-barrel domain containing protein [Streptomyces sp. ISL-1]